MASGAVIVRDWLAGLLASLPIGTTADKTPFRHSPGSEPLDGMPKDKGFHRSFRILWDDNPASADAFLPLEVIDGLTIQIGYLGTQNDRKLADLVAADVSLIRRHVMQPEPPDMPVELYNINILPSGPPRDVGGSGGNVLVKDVRFEMHFVEEAVT